MGAMKDGVCGRVMQVPAKKICAENGSPDVDACFVTQSVAMLKERGCPVGYSLRDGVCYQDISAQPRMVCEDQSKPAEMCSVTHRVEPVVRPVCPAGSIQDPVSPMICIEKTVFEPVSVCEDGSAPEDCQQSIELPYGYQCPFGSVSSKGGCEKVSNVDALEICAEGAILINGSCVSTVPAV